MTHLFGLSGLPSPWPKFKPKRREYSCEIKFKSLAWQILSSVACNYFFYSSSHSKCTKSLSSYRRVSLSRNVFAALDWLHCFSADRRRESAPSYQNFPQVFSSPDIRSDISGIFSVSQGTLVCDRFLEKIENKGFIAFTKIDVVFINFLLNFPREFSLQTGKISYINIHNILEIRHRVEVV